MNAIIDFSTLARRYVYDDVQGVRTLRSNRAGRSIEISVKFRFRATNKRILDALYDRSFVQEHFDEIDTAGDRSELQRIIKRVLKQERLNIPASVVLELPKKGVIRVDIALGTLTGHCARATASWSISLEEAKLVGKRIVAAVSCLDEILKLGSRSEPYKLKDAKKPGYGYRVVKGLNDPDLGPFEAMLTIVEYSPKTLNTHELNVTGGFDYEDKSEKVRLGEYVMHSAEELEFRGFLERG